MGVKTRSFDRLAPQRYKLLTHHATGSGASLLNVRILPWTFARKGVLVDVIATLEVAGSITAITVTPKKNNNQALCSTNGVITVAAGVGATVDAKSEVALPAGGTRFVLHSTVGNRTFIKGDVITVDLAQSGTTTTPAQVALVFVFEGEE